MELSQCKYEHVRLHAIHIIEFEKWGWSPRSIIWQSAAYLGSNIQHNGDHDNEITTRINAAWLTFMKLDPFWRKVPITMEWKLRVRDAVINTKVLYGMETFPTTPSDYDKHMYFPSQNLPKDLEHQTPIWVQSFKQYCIGNSQHQNSKHWRLTNLNQRILKFFHIIGVTLQTRTDTFSLMKTETGSELSSEEGDPN